MDKIKRYLGVKMPIIRACYSQDITPQERGKHMRPVRTTRKSPHDWEVPGREHPVIKRKVK